MVALGTASWLSEIQDAINASDSFRDRASAWNEPLALGLDGANGSWFARLHLADGRCERVEVVDEEDFLDAKVRIRGPEDRWEQVLTARVDPLRCLLLHRLELVGDPLRTMKFLPAAKALLSACASVELTANTAVS